MKNYSLDIINTVKLRDLGFKGGWDHLHLELLEKASQRKSTFNLISKNG